VGSPIRDSGGSMDSPVVRDRLRAAPREKRHRHPVLRSTTAWGEPESAREGDRHEETRSKWESRPGEWRNFRARSPSFSRTSGVPRRSPPGTHRAPSPLAVALDSRDRRGDSGWAATKGFDFSRLPDLRVPRSSPGDCGRLAGVERDRRAREDHAAVTVCGSPMPITGFVRGCRAGSRRQRFRIEAPD